jgi:hypothetical protein
MTSLLAACLLLQADSAEETFRKIEETLSLAKSVRVDFAWDGAAKSDRENKVGARGSVLLKEGNRASLLASVTEKNQTSELRIISDGTTVKARLGPKRMLECETPKRLETGLKMALQRLGALQTVLIAHKICMMDPAEQEDALNLEKRPALSDFKQGDDDGDWKTMTYKITSEGADSAAEVRLWYRPESLKLVKRTIMIKRPAESVFTEVYKDWSIDGEMDDEEFTLPTIK